MPFLFDLDPMTMTLELDLDIGKMFLYTENEIPSQWFKSYSPDIDRQTHTHTDPTEIIT